MGTSVAGADLTPGMVLALRAGSWMIESIERLETSDTPLLRLNTVGGFTGARRSMVVGPKRQVTVTHIKELA